MPTVFEQQAAEIVRKAREFKGLSQQEFGRQIGRTQTVVSKYERGETPVPGEIVIQCMSLLGVLDEVSPSADDVAELVRTVLGDPKKSKLRRAVAGLVRSIKEDR